MNNVFKRIISLIIITSVFVISISTLFFSAQFKSAQEIGDVDHLTGQRIGCISAFEADYLLTDRKDMNLLRYDSEADAIVALCYRACDGVALVKSAAQYIQSKSTGLAISDEAVAHIGLTLLFTIDNEFFDEFNDFIKEFRNSDDYAGFCERVENQVYTDGYDIYPETGTGKTIKIGYIPNYMPVVYLDAIYKVPSGSEVELMKRFANAYDYKIEWILTSEEIVSQQLVSREIDVYVGGYTDVYREEAEMSDYVDMTDSYLDSDVVLLYVSDYDNLSISSYVSEEEE